MNWRFCVGVLLALAIGAGCRWLGVPVPAPPVLVGALLVVAMTSGYTLTDKVLASRPARNAVNCGGPTGQTQGSRS
ncbi:XapX domain-containing protein [Myxococcus sp. K15C18031901]|uniref:XapX domain-containing protein n=1 Tax=Myxococcus dinghuensis TaxID=2906761 RepID=UPI0020A777E2|nr:XapX domain-containing protein [Myxococcus dinghuensis]MCP3097530.1 XapX domain-containing protein [Myxococcus dinghuensis]